MICAWETETAISTTSCFGQDLMSRKVLVDRHIVFRLNHEIIGWEKRNNVNAKEYGYYVED